MIAANKPTYKEALQQIVQQYRDAGQPWPADKRSIAGWAYSEGLWKPTKKSAIDELAKDLGRAMRDEYMTDPQGRKIRRKHARRVEVELPEGEIKQMTLWDDITTATPEHMQFSFQQRRFLVLADCNQLKNDVDSYNDNWNSGTPLQFSFDFSEDLEEMQMPTEYPDGEDEDDEDFK